MLAVILIFLSPVNCTSESLDVQYDVQYGVSFVI